MTLSVEAQENLNNILTALDQQMQLSENAAFQAALKYYAVLACLGSNGGGGGTVDTSTLAKEATLTGINTKLPDLSSGNVPVVVAEKTLTPDKRILTANTTIPAGSIYCYLKVIAGDITIDGLTYSTGEFINYESCYPCIYPAIEIVIPAGKSVRLDRGY